MSRILFAGGGSIGHIAPSIAVLRAAEKLEPGTQAYFVCSTRLEDGKFLQKENVPFTALGGRVIPLWQMPVALVRAWKLLRTVKPDVVFTKGGGVTLPIAVAAKISGIPIVVHESDAIPGRATRFISRFASICCYGFPQEVTSYELRVTSSRNPKPETRNQYVGNPLRTEITQGSRQRGLEITGLSGTQPILLVTGGSQGALTFNQAIIRHVDELLRIVDIIHITGEGKPGVEGAKAGYWKSAFVHEDLAHLYAASDLALSRAGSSNIGELAANGIPSILVPLEGVAQNHQVKNAEAAAQSGGCVVLPQALLESGLVGIVTKLGNDVNIRTAMRAAIGSLRKKDADVSIARLLLESAKR